MSDRTALYTSDFYSFEIRGRGWANAPYPVALEPPFRWCRFSSVAHQAAIDDGRRETLITLAARGLKRLFSGETKDAAAEATEELPPFPEIPTGERVTLTVSVPPDLALSSPSTEELLVALLATTPLLSFELIATAADLTLQLSVPAESAEAVSRLVESYAPGVAVVPCEDALLVALAKGSGHVTRYIDLGLSEEFFLSVWSLQEHTTDPFLPLLSGMKGCRPGEALVYQVLATRAENPWRQAVLAALDDGAGGSTIADAPWFPKVAREKLGGALAAVVVRVGARARDEERCFALIRETGGFFRGDAPPMGNAIVPLSPLPGQEDIARDALRGRYSYRTGMLLSVPELATYCHLPDRSIPSSLFPRLSVHTAPVPAGAVGHELVIGTNTHRGVSTPVSVKEEDRFAHTWVIGGSGTGKSTLLARLILADLHGGRGALVLDPHGELVDEVLARVPRGALDRVILFDPLDESPLGFNVLQAESDAERELLAADLVGILARFTASWGDGMSTVLGNAVAALLARPETSTLLDLKQFLGDTSARSRMLDTGLDPIAKHFFAVEFPQIGSRSIGPLLARLDQFVRMKRLRAILGQPTPAPVLKRAMEEGKVLLARLPKGQLGSEASFLIGSLLLAKLAQLALARQGLPEVKRRPFFAYLDEGQSFVTPSLTTLAAEGRKYEVGLVFAHQTLAQLASVPEIEGALLANCQTRLIFRVPESDAATLAKGLAAFPASSLSSLGRGEVVARFAGQACNLVTEALPPVSEQEAAERRLSIAERTRSTYGAIPVVVPAVETPAAPASIQAAPPPLPAAPVAPEVLAIPPPPVRKPPPKDEAKTGRGGERHKYLQHLVKRLAEERGFRATIEGDAGPGQADVWLTREGVSLAVEISVSTSVSHERANIEKCIAAGATLVFLISSEKRTRERVAAALTAAPLGVPVSVLAPEEVPGALDALPSPESTPKQTRGYTVRVRRVAMTEADVGVRRESVAAIVARSLGRV